MQGCFSFLPGQADEGAGGPGVAIQEAGDLVWLCWGLALKEQEAQGFEEIPQVGAWQEGQDG